MNDNPTIDLVDLAKIDLENAKLVKVLVTPYRHYGFEEEAGEQPWEAEVLEIDAELDRLRLREWSAAKAQSGEGRWYQRSSGAGHQERVLRVWGEGVGEHLPGCWIDIANSHPNAILMSAESERDAAMRELGTCIGRVRKVSYGERENLAQALFAAQERLAQLESKLKNAALAVGAANDRKERIPTF